MEVCLSLSHLLAGSFVKQHSEQPGMDRIRGLDHLKEMMDEQKREGKEPRLWQADRYCPPQQFPCGVTGISA